MLVYLQNLILEMVARGEELRSTLERLCREVERLAPGTLCSILSVDADGALHPIAGPSLSDDYNNSVEGVRIGPAAGSCGTAAFRRREVTVTDIRTDPLWADFRSLAEPLGLLACWSSPILLAGGVVATFAFYYRECRGPTEFEREIVSKCLPLCQIAYERDHRLRINERLLYTDTLTGLHNRACFEQGLIEPSLAGSSALLLIDIDDLKLVNDTFGHGTGDSLIRIIANRLAEASAPHRAFRVGGDELAILATTSDVVPLADRILESLRQPADCGGHVLVPSITIGAAVRSIDDKSGLVMRQNADLALYHGKEDGGRGTLVLYAPELRTRMNRRLRAIDQLRRAIAEERIEARYQPIARLDTGEVLSFEALARIRRGSAAVDRCRHRYRPRRGQSGARRLRARPACRGCEDDLRRGRCPARSVDARGHRERLSRPPRCDGAEADGRAAQDGGQARARRFRHGLCLAHASAVHAGRHAQDRQELCRSSDRR
ncbi:MAG: diguanylate cyclase [Sphingomonas sp.]|nr:diguanylate cyclase [Sphingomonas sp.]